MSGVVYAIAWFAALLFYGSQLRLAPISHRWPTIQSCLGRSGACAMWIHIACAYLFEHHGSHQAAVAHVAERTQQTIGISSGAGIYFNLAVALTWTWSAFCAGGPESLRKTAQIFLWLMWISASIFFAKLPSAVCFTWVVLLVLGLNRWVSSRQRPTETLQ